MKWFLTFLILFICIFKSVLAQSRAQDSLALVDLYRSTNGASWRVNTNWLSSRPMNEWYGISLDAQGRVNCIHLDGSRYCNNSPVIGNNLVGIIPISINNLSELQSLSLPFNQLGGSIPDFNLPNLQSIELTSNRFVDSIPNFNLPNLQKLALSDNRFVGSIPNFNLPNLQSLWLANNQLSGSIPNFNFPNLITLGLRDNNLVGNIPNFNLLPNLQVLWLSTNQLSGSIPNFNLLPNLQNLWLANNQLSGSIPNFNFPNLVAIVLGNNQLSGIIPQFNFPNLITLSLERNQLSGSIPNFNFPNLGILSLDHNQLSGSIPNFNFPNLGTLSVGHNQLTGILPSLNLPRLSYLGLDSTLIDSLPNLYALPALTWLRADTNKLTFDDILPNISRHITYTKQDSIFKDTTYSKLIGQPLIINLGIDGALTTNVYNWYKNGSFYQTTSVNQLVFNSLTSVDGGVYTCRVTNPGASALTLYSRNATVKVTEPLRYADSLALIDLYDSTNGARWRVNTNWRSDSAMNTWYGIELDIQGRVSGINLRFDSLRGTLPNSLNNLTNLTYLDVQTNQIRGNIPHFSNPKLGFLDIGNNQLTGTIPNFNLPTLQGLHLFNNQLSGDLPDFSLTPNLINLLLSVNQLTGTIPNYNLPFRWFNVSFNQLTGVIPNLISTNLQLVYINNNQLTGRIPIRFQSLTNLQELKFHKNQIDSVPNLSMLTNLNPIFFQSDTNKLTFDDILPNLSRGLTYTKQDSIFRDTTYSKVTGDIFTVNLGIDGAIPTNKYKWYKNGILYDSTTVNQLTINSLRLTDAGLYTCDVTNAGAPALTLHSRKITLQVGCKSARDTSFSASLCAGQNYWLPSGRSVNTIGNHIDTLKSILNMTCDSVRYTISLINDTGGRCADSLALVQLYDSTNGANWIDKTNWRSGNPMNTWYGIRLNTQGRVDCIDLDGAIDCSASSSPYHNTYVNVFYTGNNLTGRLPNSVNNLSNLQILCLSGNQLNGTLPNFNLPNLRLLYISDNRLGGSIPSSLEYSTNLEELGLPNNQLNGQIPSQLGNLSSLTGLYLDRNQLRDNIPSTLSNLTNLRWLDLQNNQLTGSIPSSFSNLTHLWYLDLQANQLDSSIPSLNIATLRYLHVNNNKLTGNLPNFNLPNLECLNLDSNRLTGRIPTSFQNLSQLRRLRYNSNQIDSMPDLSMLPIRIDTGGYGLRSHRNKLTFDDILPNIGFATRSIFLYAPQDSIFKDTTYSKRTGQLLIINLGIDGAIPTNKYKWYKNGIPYDSTNVNQLVINNLTLAHAGVYTCEVTNPGAPALTLYSRKITLQVGCAPPRDTAITASLCSGQNYRLPSGRSVNTIGNHRDTLKSILNMTCDSLHYTISLINDTGGRCADSLALVALYDSTNGTNWRIQSFNGKTIPWILTQPITTWYGLALNAQGAVTHIHLSSDSLHGTIPPTFGIGNLMNVISIRFDGNQLNGSIPSSLGNLASLNWLYLRNNQLRDSIPSSLGNLRNLIWLDLRNNQLSGNIPSSFSNLTNLVRLDLQNNQLNGTLPDLNMPTLNSLFVNNNQFTGSIPTFINMPNLSLLNLDSNRLSGSIPISFQNLNNLRRIRYSSNQIDSMPDLSMLPIGLDTGVSYGLRSHRNKLTFDDILPNIGFATRSIFLYAPQDSIFKDTTYHKNARSQLVINLGIDGALTTNKYKWFKNGTFYDSTWVNQLVFNRLLPTDAGVYTCQVTNQAVPNLTLYSRKATVNVLCQNSSVNNPQQICVGQFYQLPSGRITTVGGTFRDTLRSVYGCDSIINTIVTLLPRETTQLPIEYDCNLAQTLIETTLFVNRNGCDSNVIRTRIAARNYIELPLQYRCNPADTPSITRRFTNQYGCDSIVNQRFALARSSNQTLTKWVCSVGEVGIRTTRDTTFLGCDSTVTTRSVLARKDSFNFLIIECSVRDTGTIRKALINRFGCDSIVIERHRLVKSDTLIQNNVVCDTLFERVDTTLLKNRHQCDSLVLKHYVFDHCVCLKQNNIYNGLIPNDSDNQNDYFNISFIERYQPNELIITDKRGMIVYRTQDYRNTWTGTYQNGEPLPEGIYDYVFRTRHPVTQKECLRIGTLTITYIP
jgi:Leucine-rich repeat (LRR) protein